MNHESLDRQTQHVTDVYRAEASFDGLTSEEIKQIVFERQNHASVRWEQCNKCFRMLFMALNRGNRFPIDSFDIKIMRKEARGKSVDVLVRLWRDRRDNSFTIKPFTREGCIEDHGFTAEKFSDSYTYTYGTYHSKTAKLAINHDAPSSELELVRIDGKLVDADDSKSLAVLFAALESQVLPSLEKIEDTLMMVTEAARDPELNPDHARKFRIEH